MNRSIEGNSSICVWVAPTELQMHFMSLLLECLINTHWGQVSSSFGVMSLRDNVALLTFMSVHFILVAIVHTKITYRITILFSHYYYGITMPLQQPYDWFITNILHMAVGCKHTGYKSLMAGLATEWIYDAFAVWTFFIGFSSVLRQTLWTHQPLCWHF